MGGNGQKRHLQGTPSTDHFSDLSGCDLMPSLQVQARDRQATRGRRKDEGGLMPMAWGSHKDAE